MPFQAGPPEGHEARLVRVQREAEPAKALAQHLQNTLTTLPIREGDDKVIGESNQLAGALHSVLDRALEPIVQHMVQIEIREQRAEHSPYAKGNFRCGRRDRRKRTAIGLSLGAFVPLGLSAE